MSLSEDAQQLRGIAEAFDALWEKYSEVKEEVATQINEIFGVTGPEAPQAILDQVEEIKAMMEKTEQLQTSCNGVRDGINDYCESIGY